MTTRPIELETLCRKCLRTWIPTTRDFRAGTWHICPDCRATEEAKEAA